MKTKTGTRTFWLATVLAALTGCQHSGASGTMRIGGFCVPENRLIPGVPWAEQAVRNAPPSFAFTGCWQRAADGCDLPSTVINGEVKLDDNLKGWHWEDFEPNAFYRRVTVDGRPQLEVLGDQRYLVVSNEALTKDWYIWRTNGQFDPHSPKLGSGDALVEVCSARQPVEAEKDGYTTMCSRHITASDYSVQYASASKNRFPIEFEADDAQVIELIESWRCKSVP